MEDADVSRQIQQMASFIRQEAEEKAEEVSLVSILMLLRGCFFYFFIVNNNKNKNNKNVLI
jgi:hypoxanthine-guanine phosphoribosyltransferase